MRTASLSAALLACCVAGAASGNAGALQYSFAGKGSAAAIEQLWRRVLTAAAHGNPAGGASAAELAAVETAVASFQFELVKSCGAETRQTGRSGLCFTVTGGGTSGPVKVAGTSGPDIARGLGTYLRSQLACSFAWNRTGGNSIPSPLNLPQVWPAVDGEMTSYRNSDISYYSNVVTMSYSHVWWTFDDWASHADWLALNGINLALAYTGTEEIERKTFAEFGISNDTFAKWTNAAAWVAWSRGQSMHGVGSIITADGKPSAIPDPSGMTRPVPTTWMAEQWGLQRKILGRFRELGIVSVLPSFQGNVPPALATLMPHANISVQGDGRHYAGWLDGLDPLFGKIGDVWMKHLINDFGTDGWYEADGYFTAGRPPWLAAGGGGATKDGDNGGAGSSVAQVKAHAEAAYGAINRTDPDGIWYYQGWILGGADDFTKGLVAAVPLGKLVISDMRCEDGPGGCEWSGDDDFSFFGAPFVWGVLHNFGGTLGMWGSLPQLNSATHTAFDTQNATVAGVGMFPEGINTNPIYYQFLLDTNWAATPVSMEAWLERYAIERYSLTSDNANRATRIAVQAWVVLGRSVYGAEQGEGAHHGNDYCSASDGITSYPLADEEHVAPPRSPWYNETESWVAWQLLLDLADELAVEDTVDTGDGQQHRVPPQKGEGGGNQKKAISSTLSYDLVNVGRECLAKLSNQLFWKLENAASLPAVKAAAAEMVALQRDTDRLLCGDEGFSFGRWLLEARAWGSTDDEADYFEWQARAQPTTWLPACPNRPAGGTSNHTADTCGSRSDLADCESLPLLC